MTALDICAKMVVHVWTELTHTDVAVLPILQEIIVRLMSMNVLPGKFRV